MKISFMKYLCVLLAPCFCSFAEQADRVRLVEGGSGTIGFSALAVNSKARKLYAGQAAGYDPTNGGICVFDVDALGEVTGSDERVYPVLPDGEEKLASRIACIRVAPDGRKLYVARDRPNETVQKTLIVYDLNEKGEPTGKPRAYKNGNPHFVIWDMVVDPRATFLYSVGWGGPGVYAMPLTKGEPSGEPVAHNVGGQGKISIMPSEKWDSFLLGTYPSIVEVVSLDATGAVESPSPGSPFSFKAADALIYLPLARVGRCLYFVVEGKLWSWPMSSEWQPVERPQAHPEVKAQSVLTGAHDSLYVVLDDSEWDASGKNVVAHHFRVAQFKPDAKGKPGKAVYESQPFERKTCLCITVDETLGFIYIVPSR